MYINREDDYVKNVTTLGPLKARPCGCYLFGRERRRKYKEGPGRQRRPRPAPEFLYRLAPNKACKNVKKQTAGATLQSNVTCESGVPSGDF